MNQIAKLLRAIVLLAIITGSLPLFSTEKLNKRLLNNEPSAQTTKTHKIVYKNYINQDFGIQLSYPESYELKEDLMGTVVVFFTEQKNSSDLFQENLNVMVQDLSAQPMTLAEYTDLSREQIKLIVTDSKILSSKKITLAGNPAYEFVYTGKQGQIDLKWKQKYTIIGDTAYLLTYTSEIDEFDNYLDAFNQIFASFKLID